MEALRSAAALAPLLALHRLPGVGPVTLSAVLQRFSTAEAFFAQRGFYEQQFRFKPDAVALANGYADQRLNSPLGQFVSRDLNWLAQSDQHHIVPLSDPYYPPQLAAIHDPPAVLFVQGDPTALATPQLAIVGSRSASREGLQNASCFAAQLSSSGLTVTSGLAKGIDGAAHSGCLQGEAPTVAVIGSGLDQIYPKRHLDLAHEIVASGGAVISEFPIGTKPHPSNFPRRNRIISGLSLGVLVVEASLKSGSLITARFALEQNREVFSIPSAIHTPLGRGSNHLIRQGAKLVESVEDILTELPRYLNLEQKGPKKAAKSAAKKASDPTSTPPNALGLSEAEQTLLNSVGGAPKSLDEITVECLKFEMLFNSSRKVTALLSLLELKQLIQLMPGGYVRA